MKIKSIEWKNFGSYGNTNQKIEFDSAQGNFYLIVDFRLISRFSRFSSLKGNRAFAHIQCPSAVEKECLI